VSPSLDSSLEPTLDPSLDSAFESGPAARGAAGSPGSGRGRRRGSGRRDAGRGRDRSTERSTERSTDIRTTAESDQDTDPEADPEALARQIVLRKLAAQARTRHELATALAAKRVPPEAAATVLDRFTELGLIDDAQFALDWVESRQGRRGLSRTALRRELQTRGVDKEHIEAALAPVGSEEELAAARQLMEKKVRSMGRLEPEVRYRRLAGALARRGFGSGVISTVLDELDRD
jgi:regulatory protein